MHRPAAMFHPAAVAHPAGPGTTAGARRSAIVDALEQRYLALHEGDREAAARNLVVDLIMVELRAGEGSEPLPGPAATRRYQRAAVIACGVFRLPMDHAPVIYGDTVEHAVRRMLPAPFGFGGVPISRREAAALTTRRAA